jgi:hypothetical protein
MAEMRGEDEKRWAGKTLNGLHSYCSVFAYLPKLEVRGCQKQTYNRGRAFLAPLLTSSCLTGKIFESVSLQVRFSTNKR